MPSLDHPATKSRPSSVVAGLHTRRQRGAKAPPLRVLSVSAACAWLWLAWSAGAAGHAQKPYEPRVSQPGKDVVWVPTSQALVERMLDLAKVTAEDYVVDLGSGDGRTVIAAARRGARAHGIEYDADLVEFSQRNAAAAGVSDKASFEKADLFASDFSKASVITMFLLTSINLKLRPALLELEPGTRIVSNTFGMDEWKPDEASKIDVNCTSWCTALLWIVPAKVDGVWRHPQGSLVLKQRFQTVSGTLGGREIGDGRLRGEEITFTADGVRYTGRVNGEVMTGAGWTATRARPPKVVLR